jgi:poly(3-hydroxyalkanoate) depolymerase
LLCNGIGASLEVLDPFVDQLDPGITTVRFDVPGVGGSSNPKVPYNYPILACAAATMMTRLGFHDFDVLGISWGGGLAQQIALQYPRRCRRVVLVSTATGSLMASARPGVLSKMVTPRRYRDPDYAASIAADVYGGRMRETPDEVRHFLHALSRAGSRRGYVFQLLAGAGWTSLPALPLIHQRTLILAGDDDPIVPLVNARIMARLMPRSRLYVFHDGHLGLVTSAEELALVVGRFLEAR